MYSCKFYVDITKGLSLAKYDKHIHVKCNAPLRVSDEMFTFHTVCANVMLLKVVSYILHLLYNYAFLMLWKCYGHEYNIKLPFVGVPVVC